MAMWRESRCGEDLSWCYRTYDEFSTNFYALKAFNQKFGQWYPSIHQYQVSAKWQSALSLSGTLGNWVGYFYGAWIVDKIGYRKALMLNYVLIVPLIGEFTRDLLVELWTDTTVHSHPRLCSESMDDPCCRNRPGSPQYGFQVGRITPGFQVHPFMRLQRRPNVLRLGSLSCPSQGLPDGVGQLLLDAWRSFCFDCHHRDSRHGRPTDLLSTSLGNAVDLANPVVHRHVSRSRIPMVAHP